MTAITELNSRGLDASGESVQTQEDLKTYRR